MSIDSKKSWEYHRNHKTNIKFLGFLGTPVETLVETPVETPVPAASILFGRFDFTKWCSSSRCVLQFCCIHVRVHPPSGTSFPTRTRTYLSQCWVPAHLPLYPPPGCLHLCSTCPECFGAWTGVAQHPLPQGGLEDTGTK